jgi:hypothetical protein
MFSMSSQEILFHTLRQSLPRIAAYSDKMFLAALKSTKDLQDQADRFVSILQSDGKLQRNQLIGKGVNEWIRVKEYLKRRDIPVSAKTLIDNMFILEAAECDDDLAFPGYRAAGFL